MLDLRWLAGPFALLSVIGLACAPTTRVYDNLGGQGGQGTGGTPDVGGGGSASSASSMSSGSSSSGMCAAVEDCFNGVDDDCNGTTDCSDPACNAVAVCEPLLPSGASGVIVPGTDACPEGFAAGEQIIHHGLVDGGCTGCACKPGAATCTGDVWYYAVAGNCALDANLTGGVAAGSFGAACDANKPISGSTIYGARTSAWKLQQACSATGTATLAPAAWAETMKFCQATSEGKGCGNGNTCVPKSTAAPHCALAAGSTSCPGFAMSQSDWYTDFSDKRVCGACGCSVSGGDCSPVQLGIGSDYTCGTATLVNEASKQCFPNGIYAPPVQLTGQPIPGKCTGDASVTGSLDGTGQSTLCCQP